MFYPRIPDTRNRCQKCIYVKQVLSKKTSTVSTKKNYIYFRIQQIHAKRDVQVSKEAYVKDLNVCHWAPKKN